MQIGRIVVGQLEVNCFVVSDEATSKALIIDPGDEVERISEAIDSGRLKPEFILCTHAHYDHVCAAGDLKKAYGAPLVMHEGEADTYASTRRLCVSWGYEPEDFPPPDRTVTDGETVTLGSLTFRVIHTPGHTPGGICLFGEDVLFTGDTLFRGSVGRTDLAGGDMQALLSSLEKLLRLPAGTRVLSGHGEETTIGREAAANPFLAFGNRHRE
jgi:glyoxylase-like metal-dependent hydrolase (beta-lactamase superfamily II)